ncbi:E3 ubiquitin-protein ligase RNF115 isoform X2 [Triplophysa dalaica]|uniref:E3 ubiquitin-protein ligase RNF115 isoform X2 n=1 Tax=Triplophysa dalaica TaxID=1582913 RepID=UPI0024E03600|nr:E3 ubiquitin-protein ligase RNF115 isoform X2 [Triplophysa dalaica]
MAEAAAAPRHRYFCHCCKCEIDPKLPEYVCPRCESGFIEELSENNSLQRSDVTGAGDEITSQFSELWQLLFMERSALLSDPTVTDVLRSRSGVEAAVGAPASGPVGPVASTESSTVCTEPSHLPQVSSSHQRNPRLDQGQAMEGIVQQFLAGLFTNSDITGSQPSSWSSMLHSNPEDYAWGQGGLDAVITQHASWNALCVKKSILQENLCGSCPVSTAITATVLCLGYNCTTPVLSAGKVWMVRTVVSSHLLGQTRHHRPYRNVALFIGVNYDQSRTDRYTNSHEHHILKDI